MPFDFAGFDWAALTLEFGGTPFLGSAPVQLAALIAVATTFLAAVGIPMFFVEVGVLAWRKELTWKRISGMLTSLFCLIPQGVSQLLLGGAVAGVYVLVSFAAPWSVPTTWATALLTILLVDFLYYWEHRISHRVSAFWALFHSVHHSGDHYDQTIGARLAFIEILITPATYLPLVLVGFDPFLVLAAYGLVVAYQQWLHTELVGKLPWLDGWLNTPSNHRAHHGRNARYLDANYGGVLIIWDRLFGTYVPETETVDYGLVDKLESRNPVSVHTFALAKLLRRAWQAPTWGAALGTLVGPPSVATVPASNPARHGAVAEQR